MYYSGLLTGSAVDSYVLTSSSLSESSEASGETPLQSRDMLSPSEEQARILYLAGKGERHISFQCNIFSRLELPLYKDSFD